MNSLTSRPVIRMRPNKSPQRVRFGAPWVFADEVVLDRRSRRIPAGEIVELRAHDGASLGLAAFNAQSRIVCRMLDRDLGARIDRGWFRHRLQQALALRARLYDAPFYRLAHAEADGLPGVVIDRFGAVAAIQPNAAWADARINDLADALIGLDGITTVVMNGMGRARKIEGLAERLEVIRGTLDGPIAVPMNGATYLADLEQGQKTGLFYDQRDNHAFAARLARGGSVLDVFTHVGGFALAALAGGARRADAVDASQAALELAARGAEASGFAGRFATIRGDAFEVMAALAAEGRQFDLVICDPPAFAPARPAVEAGLRAYERVARLGASLVAPGGFLVLCSCSHAVDPPRFRAASIRGIGRAGRGDAQLIHAGSSGPDHPQHPQLAESAYLKALFFRLA